MEAQVPPVPLNPCRAAITRHWPKELWETAFVILDHENGKENPQAVNYNVGGSVDKGCLQINSVHKWATGDLFNPDYNAQTGYTIYQQQGVRAWYAVQGILW